MSVDDSGVIGELTAIAMGLINTGAAVRFILMIINITNTEEERAAYKKKMRNLILFVIIANSIRGLAVTILSYIS